MITVAGSWHSMAAGAGCASGAARVAVLTEGLTDALAVLQQWAADGAPISTDVPAGSVAPPGSDPRLHAGAVARASGGDPGRRAILGS